MEDYEKNIEIPFGANDSELGGFEYTIPEGYEAEIKDGKVIVRKTESEDEKIRKEIINYFKCQSRDEPTRKDIHNKWIAWLEKQCEQKAKYHDVCDKCTRQPTCQSDCFLQQGEQNPAECSRVPLREMVLNVWELGNYWKELTKGVCNTEHGSQLDYIVKHWKEGEHYIKSFEKQGEQKPYGQRKECTDCQFNYAGECKGFCAMKRGEQKPAWSEEDEAVLDALIQRLEGEDIHVSPHLAVKCLKSLKDRVQPKQEWTKGDIEMIDWLIRCCEEEHKELCNDRYGHQEIVSDLKRDCRKKWDWLGSLKNKVVPQTRWKPSDEQIKAVKEAACYSSVFSEKTIDSLISLSKDLKKLKE